MNILDQDCVRNIFLYLEPHDLGNCCQVSKSLIKIGSEDLFWKEIVPDELAKTNKKNYLDSHAVTNNENYLNRINHYFNTELNCRFYTHFPFEKNISLNFCAVLLLNPKINEKHDVRETFIFMKKFQNCDKLKYIYLSDFPVEDRLFGIFKLNNFSYLVNSLLPDSTWVNASEIGNGLVSLMHNHKKQLDFGRRKIACKVITALSLAALYLISP
ncbi:MAG: hypothetical protein H0V82_11570 [Candidatus Protochlamydia sp.]|nr:hypothetical protein [Candidatus Protochlamydia sp.]